MYRLIQTEKKLMDRWKGIQHILRPLRDKARPVAVKRSQSEGRKLVFAAYDTGIEENPPDQWFFQTNIQTDQGKVYGAYYERWQPDANPIDWLLERAYLSLGIGIRRGEPPHKLLCIHCDPLDETYAAPPRIPRVKQGPHLHVECAMDPLPHCHFPLSYCHLDEVLESIDSLGKTFESLVTVLASEVRVHY